MIPYLDCPHPDHSGITLELFNNISDIPYLEQRHSVAIHQHHFYEMVLILRGTCKHYYRGSYIPLIPGDLFLIPPDQPHSYQFQENIALCNCQFFRNILNPETARFVSDIEYTALQQKMLSHKRLKDLEAFEYDNKSFRYIHSGDINSQGIIHIDQNEREVIAAKFRNIFKEQQNQKFGFIRIKQTLLEHILIQIKRVQMNQFENTGHNVTWQDEMVESILEMIEQNVAGNYDFNKIAEEKNISISYFRTIFKNITGLSPVTYLNRIRMVRALELLQTTNDSVSAVAEKVGIYDQNYFSRVFKNYIGYPPKYFKSIEK